MLNANAEDNGHKTDVNDNMLIDQSQPSNYSDDKSQKVLTPYNLTKGCPNEKFIFKNNNTWWDRAAYKAPPYMIQYLMEHHLILNDIAADPISNIWNMDFKDTSLMQSVNEIKKMVENKTVNYYTLLENSLDNMEEVLNNCGDNGFYLNPPWTSLINWSIKLKECLEKKK